VGNEDLFDKNKPILQRVRYARLRTGNKDWWSETIAKASNDTEKYLTCLIGIGWTSDQVLLANRDRFSAALESLPQNIWNSLVITFFHSFGPQIKIGNPLRVVSLTDYPGDRLPILLAIRSGNKKCIELFSQKFSEYSGKDVGVIEFCRRAIELMDDIVPQLTAISRLYVKYGRATMIRYRYNIRQTLDYPTAKRVSLDAKKFPRTVALVAQRACREHFGKEMTPIYEVARDNKWFSNT
jgi:hypothetical protein